MLDIPAYAWLTFSILCFLRYLDSTKPRFPYLTAVFLLCALYTKQTVPFAPVVFALVLLAVQGVATLRQRHVWLTALLFAVALLPLGLTEK
jgi:4-amino-4-deoxy-L-arabinose transferase-like glycosyltransferase